uniref:Hes family bHLH transcription factor 4 n=1 Tax=Anas platyrhynchos TaxID=8839 RepID=A0A8B9SYQ1_ANAPL
MPADTGPEKPTASPIAGAPATASHTPDKPRSASEHRKVNGGRTALSPQSSKPIMEKRRRARINESLGQLKTLILDALKKDSSRHSKLEKADILEMTGEAPAEPAAAGWLFCMNEVTRFLSTCEGVNADVRTRLLGHLSACLGQIVAMNYPPPPPPPPPPAGQPAHLAQPLHVQLPPAAGAVPVPCKMNPAEALSPKVYGGFQLVPATDGQFAFLIPNPAFPPGSGPVIPLYANANVPVSTGGGGSGNASATPSASPVQGLTSFGGSIVPVSQAGSPVAERSESVWRPW